MKKSAKIFFIICTILTIVLCASGVTFIILRNKLVNLTSNSNYTPTNTGIRKDSYILTLPDVDMLDKYQEDGQDLLVVFLASWCHFCQDESPELDKFINDNPDKKIIVVSHDETIDDIQSFLITNNYNWFVIFDPDTLIRSHIDPEGSGIPAAYLLDSNGNILNQHIGKQDYDGLSDLYNY